MRKKEVKAALFDLDGVLVDSLDAWFYVFNDTLKHFGLKELSKEEFAKDFGAPIERDMKKHYKNRTIKEVESQYNKNFKHRNSTILCPKKLLRNFWELENSCFQVIVV